MPNEQGQLAREGHLGKLTGRSQVIAYVSTGLAAFSYVTVTTASSADSLRFFLGLFYLMAFVAVVSSVGAVVGRLLLAARRDADDRAGTSPAGPSQDWYQ